MDQPTVRPRDPDLVAALLKPPVDTLDPDLVAALLRPPVDALSLDALLELDPYSDSVPDTDRGRAQ